MIGFFKDDAGNNSMGRLIAFILVIAGLIAGAVGIGLKFEGTAAVVGAFVGAGTLEKVISKFAERKNGQT